MTNVDLKEAIDELRVDMRRTTDGLRTDVSDIKQTLAELTGAKKILIWIAGITVGIASALGAWFGTGHK